MKFLVVFLSQLDWNVSRTGKIFDVSLVIFHISSHLFLFQTDHTLQMLSLTMEK